MKSYASSKSVPASLKKPVIALGNFDGVHLAHQKMFKLAIAQARKLHGTAMAYTFNPHPVSVLSPASAPKMITTLKQRLELMADAGLDAVVVEPFDVKFAQLSAEQWFHKIIQKRLHVAGLVVGYDFTFGSHRSGKVADLEEWCVKAGIHLQVLEAAMVEETLISSSHIRRFVSLGQIAQANALLGRAFFIDGRVIRGAGRGAKLGIRTANLKTDNELLPMGGVYACYAEVEKRRYLAVTNIGSNPTFGGKSLSIEAHLLKFRRDIYGKKLRLHFINRIRDEHTFASVDDLIVQIRRDITQTEKILAD